MTKCIFCRGTGYINKAGKKLPCTNKESCATARVPGPKRSKDWKYMKKSRRDP